MKNLVKLLLITTFTINMFSCDDDNIVNANDDFNFNIDFIGTWQEKYFKNQMNLWFDSEYFHKTLNYYNQVYSYEDFCLLLGSSLENDICTYEFYQYYILPTSDCSEFINFDTGNNFSDDNIPLSYDCNYDDLGSELQIISQQNFEENFSSAQITYTENGVVLSNNIDNISYTMNYILINDTLLESSVDITEVILMNFTDGIEGYLQGIPAKGINSIIQKVYYDKLR